MVSVLRCRSTGSCYTNLRLFSYCFSIVAIIETLPLVPTFGLYISNRCNSEKKLFDALHLGALTLEMGAKTFHLGATEYFIWAHDIFACVFHLGAKILRRIKIIYSDNKTYSHLKLKLAYFLSI